MTTVRIGNYVSASASVVSGVPQGSVLGPTLFLLHIYDVGDIFTGLTVSLSLFGDDVKMYARYILTILTVIYMLSFSPQTHRTEPTTSVVR